MLRLAKKKMNSINKLMLKAETIKTADRCCGIIDGFHGCGEVWRYRGNSILIMEYTEKRRYRCMCVCVYYNLERLSLFAHTHSYSYTVLCVFVIIGWRNQKKIERRWCTPFAGTAQWKIKFKKIRCEYTAHNGWCGCFVRLYSHWTRGQICVQA